MYPLGGLFLAHAEAGLHCTVQSITPPWPGCSGLMHLNHFGALCGSYTFCFCLANLLPISAVLQLGLANNCGRELSSSSSSSCLWWSIIHTQSTTRPRAHTTYSHPHLYIAVVGVVLQQQLAGGQEDKEQQQQQQQLHHQQGTPSSSTQQANTIMGKRGGKSLSQSPLTHHALSTLLTPSFLPLAHTNRRWRKQPWRKRRDGRSGPGEAAVQQGQIQELPTRTQVRTNGGGENVYQCLSSCKSAGAMLAFLRSLAKTLTLPSSPSPPFSLLCLAM